MKTFHGKREALTYGDWRKLGWDKEQSRRCAEEAEVVEAFVYVESEHQEPTRLAVNTSVPTQPGENPATRRDEFAFEWGYEGSGPHATARAMLASVLLEEPVPWLSQEFKREVIGRQDKEGFTITEAQIGEWADWTLANTPPPTSYPQAIDQLTKLSRAGAAARRRARA